MASYSYRNSDYKSDGNAANFRRACDLAERLYDDRWPARGLANAPTNEYKPLDNVSRGGYKVPYRKYPSAS
jgi:hypothetical protein